MAIALSSGDNPRLTCEAYFAITSNTVQFGAQADLYASAYGFSVEGDVGFDVLIQIVPLHFIADFNAAVQLKHGSSNLFKVSVDGRARGAAAAAGERQGHVRDPVVRLLGALRQDAGRRESAAAAAAIDVSALLTQALARPQSWTAVRPVGRIQGVTLRSRAAGRLRWCSSRWGSCR